MIQKEIKKPEKPKHSMFCPQVSAKHIRCACDQKELIELYDDFEAYYKQELAKEKAKRVGMLENLQIALCCAVELAGNELGDTIWYDEYTTLYDQVLAILAKAKVEATVEPEVNDG